MILFSQVPVAADVLNTPALQWGGLGALCILMYYVFSHVIPSHNKTISAIVNDHREDRALDRKTFKEEVQAERSHCSTELSKIANAFKESTQAICDEIKTIKG